MASLIIAMHLAGTLIAEMMKMNTYHLDLLLQILCQCQFYLVTEEASTLETLILSDLKTIGLYIECKREHERRLR